MTTGILLPLELAVLLCAGFAAAGAWAAQTRVSRRFDPKPNSLQDLLKAENLGKAVGLAARRDAQRAASRAVLHGRIHQPAGAGSARQSDEMRDHVAAVMRAGLRRGDSFSAVGDSFTITLAGADERAALRIAHRLRRTIATMRLPHSNSDARLTASFGVAGGRMGDDYAVGLHARRALGVALAHRMEHVVPASSMNDILLLPAPSPAAATAA